MRCKQRSCALRLRSSRRSPCRFSVSATHSAPRRPPRCSRHASGRRRTAYHRFGLREDGAGPPDGRRGVYSEAYEEAKCDRHSADQSETSSSHMSLPVWISPPKASCSRSGHPNVDLDQSGGDELAKAPINMRQNRSGKWRRYLIGRVPLRGHGTNPLTRERAARGSEFVATTVVPIEIG